MTTSTPVTADVKEISLGGKSVPFNLKRSRRAKQVRLEIRHDSGLTVVVPALYRLSGLPRLLREKQAWILRHLDSFRERRPTPRRELHFGDSVTYMGHNLKLVRDGNGVKRVSVKVQPDSLEVVLPDGVELRKVVECWFRERAKRVIAVRVAEMSAKMGLRYGRITIRSQRTRWASCSQKSNLSFNWRLITLPEPVLEYVIIHELCHLTVMDHSARFWGLVAGYCPSWREYRAYLKHYETSGI